MKEMKRILSLVLCFVMVLGMLPMVTLNADAAEAPIDAAVIFSDLHLGTNTTNKEQLVKDVFTVIKNNVGTTVSSVASAGDMYSSNEGTMSGNASTVTGYVQQVFPGVPVNYVWTDHDRAATDISKESRLVYEGNYYVYLLSMADLSSWDRYSAGFYNDAQIAEHIQAFKGFAAGLDKSKPLFIVGHQPLFDNRGDNGHAYEWTLAINEVAKTMDVAYFFGHNHNYDDITGTPNDYYYPKGSTMSVPKNQVLSGSGYSTDLAAEDVTLNFTHICAGYMDPGTKGSTTRTGTALAAVIYEDHITYTVYDKNGVYSANAAMAVNADVPRAFNQQLESDYVEIPGGSGTDDVTTSGNDWTTITEEKAAIEEQPGSTTYKYTLDTDGTITDAADDELGYLFVGASNGYAMTLNNGSLGRQSVTIASNAITLNEEPSYQWWITSDRKITNGTQWLRFSASYTSASVSLTDSESQATVWTIDSRGSGQYRVSASSDYATYYLYYRSNSSNFVLRTSANNMRMFKGEKIVAPGIEGSDRVPGLYAYLKGQLTYHVTADTNAEQALAMVKEGIDIQYATYANYSDEQNYGDDAEGMTWVLDPAYDPSVPGDYAVTIAYNGNVLGTAEVVVSEPNAYYRAEGSALLVVDESTSAAEALAAVKDGITIYKASDASGTGQAAVSDDTVNWVWADAYNPFAAGPYTVNITKGGKTLASVEVKVNVQNGGETENGDSNSVTIGGSGTTEKKTIYVRVDSFVNGEEYLLVGEDAPNNGNPIVMVNSNGSDTYVPVTVNTGSVTVNGTTYSKGYIELNNANAVFTASGSSSNGYTLKNGSHYIGGTGATTLYTSSSSAVRVTYDANASRLRTASGTTRYLYYSTSGSETWKWSTSSSSSTSSRAMYIYQKMEAEVSSDSSVTYTMQAANVRHNVNGTSVTEQLKYALLANGTAASTLPAGGAYSFTVVGDSRGIIADISDTGLITFNNVSGSCRVRVAYSWSDGTNNYTVYKYVTVTSVAPTNYPEYPNEGAVKVSKTATGLDFQSSGIAQVEVSASGVPMKVGVDIIVMLDMSSSMNRHSDCGENSCTDSSCSKVTRLTELKNALINMQNILKSSDSAEAMNIVFADFNGFYGYNGKSSGTPYDRASEDNMGGTLNTNGSNHRTGAVYNAETGAVVSIGADAFVSVADMDVTKVNARLDSQKATQGTNYDHGFDVIYQLGHAIKERNEQNGEPERELIVIFMSDGAPNQYNYYHSIGGQTPTSNDDETFMWNKWLQGTFTANQLTASNIGCADHSHYYDSTDHDGDGIVNEHRMATAIKGDPNERYEVIRKNQSLTGNASGNDAVTELLESTGKENLYTLPGLGATMYAVGFHIKNDGKITEKSVNHVLQQVPSTADKYFEATNETALKKAFSDIATDILYAAYNARFVDQMGEHYDLQMSLSNYSVVDGNTTTDKSITPKIEIITYDIYTKADADAGDIPADKHIGDRKGTFSVLETITFNADGTEAYSDKKTGNILIDGVICAQTFWYNTDKVNSVPVEGVSIPTGKDSTNLTTGSTNMLPPETFYWNMGTVKTSELAMRYNVYLTGSREGNREGGSYPTNEFATLYYDNYLNNPCYKNTVSPVMPWKEANVSYAFYLVDENGNIIVNQTTGQTGTFANKIAVTNPVVYETVLLNNDEEVSSIDIASLGVLPDGYTLYDVRENADGTKTGATYTVQINSNTTGSWTITSVKDVATTYVMQYNPEDASAYSNALNNNTIGHDYTHTVVWFAVVWKVQALPDTVVVDYGLPVDISVLTNDMFGENGELAGVGAYSESLNMTGHDASMAEGFGDEYKADASETDLLAYGDAKIDTTTGKVRYTLKTTEMKGYDKFAYAVHYSGATNPGYYYDTVTVIPATTIYYEDAFLTYESFTWQNGWVARSESLWVRETEVNGVQEEDRPGQYSLSDANNIYGYDDVNLNMSTHSLGHAAKATVDYDNKAHASFTFWGTGFDIISMTDNTTGNILIDVEKNVNGTWTEHDNFAVDTYYGYTKDEDGNWVVDPEATGSLYQVPIIKMANQPYGQYRVTIKASYDPGFDHVDGSYAGSYDFYLDAIRIYDPANDGAADGSEDKTIEDAYKADGEAWPSYFELRNKLISAGSLGNKDTATEIVGLVFIDGDASVGDADIKDYQNFGPNNEVYLAKNQSVAFKLSDVTVQKDNKTVSIVDHIHIGMKSADGKTVTYTIKNISSGGAVFNEKTTSISTTTDMYYDMTAWKDNIIVITNTSDSILSLTNIKATYTQNPNGAVVVSDDEPGASPVEGISTNNVTKQGGGVSVLSTAAETEPVETVETASNEVYAYMTPAAATLTLRSLNAPAVQEPEVTEPTEPETTEPEATEPEATEPETTEPEVTEPETTEPEVTEPETTVPEETEPEKPTTEEVVKEIVKEIIKVIGGWFGKWF